MGGPKTTKVEQSGTSKTALQKGQIVDLNTKFLDLAKPGEVFTGERVAPLTGLQTSVLGGAENFLPTFASPTDVSNPLAADTQAATRGVLTGQFGAQPLGEGDISDFFKRIVADPARFNFAENVRPGIEESFAGPGFFSSARSQEVSRAGENLERDLSTQQGQLQFENLLRNQQLEEAEANRIAGFVPTALQAGRMDATQALDQIQVASQQLAGLADLFGFGAAEQTQEQRVLAGDLAALIEKNNLSSDAVNIMLNLINDGVATAGVSKQTAGGSFTDLESLGIQFGAGAIGGALGGAAAGSAGGPIGAAVGAGAGALLSS